MHIGVHNHRAAFGDNAGAVQKIRCRTNAHRHNNHIRRKTPRVCGNSRRAAFALHGKQLNGGQHTHADSGQLFGNISRHIPVKCVCQYRLGRVQQRYGKAELLQVFRHLKTDEARSDHHGGFASVLSDIITDTNGVIGCTNGKHAVFLYAG